MSTWPQRNADELRNWDNIKPAKRCSEARASAHRYATQGMAQSSRGRYLQM